MQKNTFHGVPINENYIFKLNMLIKTSQKFKVFPGHWNWSHFKEKFLKISTVFSELRYDKYFLSYDSL